MSKSILLAALLASTLALAASPAVHAVGLMPTQTILVSSHGDTSTVQVPDGDYVITASGTYTYALGTGNYADAAYSWGAVGDCYDEPGNNHDLLVDGQSPWTSACDAATHTYSTPYSCTSLAGCTIAFRILDDYYNDNSGELTVSVRSTGIPSGTCIDYNPQALTNACITLSPTIVDVPEPQPTVGSQTVTVPVPALTSTPTPVCVVGPVCVIAPVPGVGLVPTPETVPSVGVGLGDDPVAVPTPGGYVEVTALCGSVGSLCHLDL